MNNHEIEPIEQMEQLLTGLQKDLSPSAEFSERMKKRLERHYVLMQERDLVGAETTGRRGFFSFLASHVYSTVTAFAFVIFTGGLSTFAYTSEGVTNGSPLYPIKRGLESIEQAFISSNPESTAEYHVKMLSRRLAESRVLTLQGRVDEPTNEAVIIFANSGLDAIQLVDQNEYRDQLFNRITALLQEEERKMYSTSGLSVNTLTDEQPVVEKRTEEQRPRPENRDIRPATTIAPQVRSFSTEARLFSGEVVRKNIIVPLSVPTHVIQAVERNSRQLQRIEVRLKEIRRRR